MIIDSMRIDGNTQKRLRALAEQEIPGCYVAFRKIGDDMKMSISVGAKVVSKPLPPGYKVTSLNGASDDVLRLFIRLSCGP